MELYSQLLKREIVFYLVGMGIIFLASVILFVIFQVFVFSKLIHIDVKKTIIGYVVFACFFVGVAATAYFGSSKMFLDLKENSYVEYVGDIAYSEEKSSKEVDVYELLDPPHLFLEAKNDIIDRSIKSCEARVIYTKHSKKILEIEVLNQGAGDGSLS